MRILFARNTRCARPHFALCPLVVLFLAPMGLVQQANAQQVQQSLAAIKEEGRKQSSYVHQTKPGQGRIDDVVKPEPNLAGFQDKIRPLLKTACFDCHGAETQEGNIRVDTLDPDMVNGEDASWWLEIYGVLSNGEMPPEDEGLLSGKDRSSIIEWLSREMQVASQAARTQTGHTSFRRMTRYEYNYALQDLLGLEFDFAKDLPPESESKDGFLNSSEMLQISASQFATYKAIAREALRKATVRGAEPPAGVHFAITMDQQIAKAKKQFEADLEKIRERLADDPEKLERELAKRQLKVPGGAYYRDLRSGFAATARWAYRGARYARKPVESLPEIPGLQSTVAIIPPNQKLIVDLGDHLPAFGTMRVKVRAGVRESEKAAASLRIFFGHQASNNSKAEERVGSVDLLVNADASEPKVYSFDIPLSEVVRNPFRGIHELGHTPNPAEYVMLRNTSEDSSEIQIDYIEISAPVYDSWPPESHVRLLPDRGDRNDDKYIRDTLSAFMHKAWRRAPSTDEVESKLALFRKQRPKCEDDEAALLDVFADVLCSPNFLYLIQTQEGAAQYELATRLSIFLWSSLPDPELLALASDGRLSEPAILSAQIDRMLTDVRAKRLSKHFVRQWLGMELIDHLAIDSDLRDAMQVEPIAFFQELLQKDNSVMDFLHADYAIVNSRLAKHYDIPRVQGSDFRKVILPTDSLRGGLLTQAGLLAMNSDGKDSHPLKRGVWLLENILNDPPPPPPPAVPEIDLSDPNILKLTLKERMEDHRNDPACMSCHRRIDPWGIAFENFGALGEWRSQISGKEVDANSVLFNNQELHGVEGLKRFLLANRQDQFARAITHKMTSYALGRPLDFADLAKVESITAELRQNGDGLQTLVKLIATSDLFTLNASHTQ